MVPSGMLDESNLYSLLVSDQKAAAGQTYKVTHSGCGYVAMKLSDIPCINNG